jgi:hypothetical protein
MSEKISIQLDFLSVTHRKTQFVRNFLWQEVHHTGSYYDGVRCTAADEFDLNIVLVTTLIKPSIRHGCSEQIS